MSIEEVEAVARSRVWTGADAAEPGLVDELGGLRTAVGRATVMAWLDPNAGVRLAGLPGSSLRELRFRRCPPGRPRRHCLRPHLGAVAGVFSAAATRVLDHQTVSATSALWQGDRRF
jgi:protease-4